MRPAAPPPPPAEARPLDVLCIGNCQAASIARQITALGLTCKYLLHLVPALDPDGGFTPAKQEFASCIPPETLRGYHRNSLLLFQPGHDDLAAYDPRIVVVTMFHEWKLHRHNTKNYLIHANFDDPQISPAHRQFVDENFSALPCAPHTYMDRFASFVAQVGSLYPGRPVVVVKRLTPFPVFGECPESWLALWNEHWADWGARILDLPNTQDNVSVLELDRIVGNAFQHGADLFAIAPERIVLTQGVGTLQQGVPVDIEHLSDSIWRNTAESIAGLLAGGALATTGATEVPLEFLSPLPHLRPEATDIARAMGRADVPGQKRMLHHLLDAGMLDNARMFSAHSATVQVDGNTLRLLLLCVSTSAQGPRAHAEEWIVRKFLEGISSELPQPEEQSRLVSRIFHDLGLLFYALGGFDLAEHYCRNALDHNAGNSAALKSLHVFSRMQGNYSQAVEMLRAYLAHVDDPQQRQSVYRDLAVTLHEAGRSQEANGVLAQIPATPLPLCGKSWLDLEREDLPRRILLIHAAPLLALDFLCSRLKQGGRTPNLDLLTAKARLLSAATAQEFDRVWSLPEKPFRFAEHISGLDPALFATAYDAVVLVTSTLSPWHYGDFYRLAEKVTTKSSFFCYALDNVFSGNARSLLIRAEP